LYQIRRPGDFATAGAMNRDPHLVILLAAGPWPDHVPQGAA
jgi:hypothetical protein